MFVGRANSFGTICNVANINYMYLNN